MIERQEGATNLCSLPEGRGRVTEVAHTARLGLLF